MKNKFRVITSEFQPATEAVDTQVRTIETLWEGPAEPSIDVIEAIKITLRERDKEAQRSPFNQPAHDMFYLQSKRSLAILGWKTLDAINMYTE